MVKASSTMASTAAWPWSFCEPTTAKKISVDSTLKLPPSTSGLPKSAMLSMKPSKKALASPGRISGQDTVRKVCQALAFRVCAASSSDGLIASTTPISTRKAIGVNDNSCAINTPLKPYTQRVGSSPNWPATNWVTLPDRPNSRISDRPITNGGVMMGKSESDLNRPRKRTPVRVSTRANASPSRVDSSPTVTASTSVFQAAPQLEPVLRQVRRQIFGSSSRLTKGAIDQVPSSARNGITNICSTGRPMNSSVSAITRPSEPVTKASPPTRPRSANPRVSRNRKLAPVSSAP